MSKKINITFIFLFLCLLLSGCQNFTKTPEEEYLDVIAHMHKEIYYHKSDVAHYLHGNLAYTVSTESLKNEDKKYGIGYFVLQPNDERITVLDNEIYHFLEPDENGKKIYRTEKVSNITDEVTFFDNIFDQHIKYSLTTSDSENIKDGKILHFTFSNSQTEDFTGKTEYDITIKDNTIIEVECRYYSIDEDKMSQQTITTYSDFNAVESLDIDSVIKEMKKQAE